MKNSEYLLSRYKKFKYSVLFLKKVILYLYIDIFPQFVLCIEQFRLVLLQFLLESI